MLYFKAYFGEIRAKLTEKIRPFLIFEDLAFFETAYGQICPFKFFGTWQPYLCLFCAAQIGFSFCNNSVILLIYCNFLPKFALKTPFLGTKTVNKSFLTTSFCKMWSA